MSKDMSGCNEHGHMIITITGLNLTGAQEVERLEAANHVGDYVKSCLMGAKAEYDAKHRLVAGQLYRIALVPGKEISNIHDRTTINLQRLGARYGYAKPLAGIVPRIRENISDKQMEEMGIWYIVAPHEPIEVVEGYSGVLCFMRDVRRCHIAFFGSVAQWSDVVVFAFVLP